MRLACLALILVATCSRAVGEEYYDYSSFYSTEGNLALGQPTFQSGEASGGIPGRAVDGGFSGRFWERSCTHTNTRRDNNSWWTVDLGASTEVKVVYLALRHDCCTGKT